mgnify:CR=1 FL=1
MSHGSGDSTSSIIGPPAGPGVQTGKRHGGRGVPRSNKDRQVNQIRSNSAEQTIHQKPQLVSMKIVRIVFYLFDNFMIL